MRTTGNYYATLELNQGADEKQIKSAFRRLARKYHPDLNPGDKAAETKFKEINEAYEVLSDPDKKKLYDRYGSNWEAMQHATANGGDPSGGINFDFGGGDLGGFFDQFFGGGPTHRATRTEVAQPADVEQTVEVTLEEIAKGTKRTLTYQVLDACKSCDGTGYVTMRTGGPCATCGGTGQVRGLLGMGQVCPSCQGTGSASLAKCPTCRGEGTMPTTKRVEVSIPAGIQDGKRLRVPGRGAVGTRNRAGDLYVKIKELPHRQFRRKGDDLETDVDVLFTTAALGGEVRLSSLTGQMTMKIPELTQSGQTFRLGGKGLPSMKGGAIGNLIVRVRITLPAHFTDKEKKLLADLAKTVEAPR